MQKFSAKKITLEAIIVLVALVSVLLSFNWLKNSRIEETALEQLKLTKTSAYGYSLKTLGDDLVEIGAQEGNPQPYLKLNKLGGEASLRINFPNVIGGKSSFDGNKLIYSSSAQEGSSWWQQLISKIFNSADASQTNEQQKVDVAFYARQPEQVSEKNADGSNNAYTVNEEGGVEFDTILYEKPLDNTIFYPMQAEGLDFYYQPALNQRDQIEGVECTETTCQDSSGKVVAYRPENVVGSYAVYYEGNRSGDYTEVGGDNYKTGKVFHIYRPVVTDANGNKVWGSLSINKQLGQLSVTVPKDFLDKAVYPVNIDPTFGYSGIGASNCWLSGNYFRGFRIITPADSNGAAISKVSLYSKEDYSGTLNYKAFIVNNNKKFVSNGIGTGAVVGASYAWVDSTFSTSPSVVDNSVYFLGLIADIGSSNLAVACDSNPGEAYLSDSTNSYASPVDPADGYLVSSSSRYSIYATYSGGTPVVIPGAHYLNYTASSTIATTHMYDSATALSPTKVFISYTNNNPGNAVGVVATVSTSTAPVYGAPVAFTTSTDQAYTASVALDSSHVFVTYGGASRIITVTGTTISYGPAYPHSLAIINVSKISSSRVLILYSGSGYGCVVADISGNVISYGSPYLFNSITNGDDPSDIAILDSTHGLAVYQGCNVGYGSCGRSFEISGTNIIYGPEYEIWPSQIFNVSTVPLTSTSAMVIFYGSNDLNSGIARIASISGTDVNYSQNQVFAPGAEVINSAVALDSQHVFISFSDYENSVYSGAGVVAAVSGNKIYFSPDYIFYPGGYPSWHSATALSPTSAFVAYAYSNYLSGGKGIVAYLGDGPNVPTLVSPLDGSSGAGPTPLLQFGYSDPSSLPCTKFDLQLDDNSDFSSPIVNETNYSTGGPWASGSTIGYQVSSSLTPLITYYWKVRVYNANGSSFWTAGDWDFNTSDGSCADHNMSGWAWSENAGWISFSCKNIGTAVNDYGIDMNEDTGLISGYVWSEYAGWISFNSSDLSGCPSGTCEARMSLTTYAVSGWAKALAAGDGWDGWIKLSGIASDSSPYGVSLNNLAKEFTGWAWGDTNMGWISFNCANQSSCGTSNYKVTTTLSLASPPTITNLTSPAQTSANYCSCYFDGETLKEDGNNSSPFVGWRYDDPGSYPLKSYQLRVSATNDVNASGPAIDVLAENRNEVSGTDISFPVPVKISPSAGQLAYNTTYYWWVKACNQADACTSDWVAGPSFGTPLKHYPMVKLAWDKMALMISEDIQFCSTANVNDPEDPCYPVCWKGTGSPVVSPDGSDWACSVCFDSSNNYQACQDTSATYNWYFPGTEGTDYSFQASTTVSSPNPQIRFLTPEKDRIFKLKVTGSDCGGSATGDVVLPLPVWKEQTPF